MMGRREDSPVQFLYAFNLDKVVPADHLVCQIDAGYCAPPGFKIGGLKAKRQPS